MLQIQTKLSSQGKVSVPAAIRQCLNLTPGAVLVWSEEGGRVTVQRAVRHSTDEVHDALFGCDAPAGETKAKTRTEMQQGIRQHLRQRHALG